MKIKKKALREPGILEKERLVLEVTADDDIGDYAVFCAKLTESGEVSARVQRMFWFPDKEVKAGSLVVLYSKKGAHHDRENVDKTTTHFFYWNLDAPTWSVDRAVIIAHLDEWESHKLSTSA